MQWYQYAFIVVFFLIIAFAIAKSNRKDLALEFNKLVELLGGKDNIFRYGV